MCVLHCSYFNIFMQGFANYSTDEGKFLQFLPFSTCNIVLDDTL